MRWLMNGFLCSAYCLSFSGFALAQKGVEPRASEGEQQSSGRTALDGPKGAAGQARTGTAALGAQSDGGAVPGVGTPADVGTAAEQSGYGLTGAPLGRGIPDVQNARMFLARLPLMIALDVDGNGVLSAAEVRSAPMTLSKLDKNADAVLTMDELMPEAVTGTSGGGLGGLAGGVPGPGAVIDPAQMAMQIMSGDKNTDGFIDKAETPARMQQMFARADLDRDGRLSREEVMQLATAMSERRDSAADRTDAGPRGADGARGAEGARGNEGARAGAADRQAEDRERSIRARQ